MFLIEPTVYHCKRSGHIKLNLMRYIFFFTFPRQASSHSSIKLSPKPDDEFKVSSPAPMHSLASQIKQEYSDLPSRHHPLHPELLPVSACAFVFLSYTYKWEQYSWSSSISLQLTPPTTPHTYHHTLCIVPLLSSSVYHWTFSLGNPWSLSVLYREK